MKLRDWWREVKQLCGTAKASGRGLKTVLHPDLAYKISVLCEKINEAFVSVMQDYSPLSEYVCVARQDDTPINFRESIVVSKLGAVSKSRAGGQDNLPNWILRQYADILASPITDILNTSFRECRVLRVWKLADVPLIPTKAPTVSDFNKDLRPISLTSTLSKIAESMIIERDLKPTILSSIDSGQFGFIPGSSTTLALISMFHHWLGVTDATGSTVRIALLDFRKAFDLMKRH